MSSGFDFDVGPVFASGSGRRKLLDAPTRRAKDMLEALPLVALPNLPGQVKRRTARNLI
jgi:hypothetical protein